MQLLSLVYWSSVYYHHFSFYSHAFPESGHRVANIICPFPSTSDMFLRMRWPSETQNASLINSNPSMCCSVNQSLAFSLNSNHFYLLPLERFPKSGTAIVLPVFFGAIDEILLSHWLTHNTRVLSADVVIVYSLNATETFDPNGRLQPFYSLNSASSTVIVNAPQIQNLQLHYHGQVFAINNALLRSIGTVEYLGSFDADEFLEIPSGFNITAYLRKKFCNNVDRPCTEFNFAGLGIGSFMVDSYSSIIDQRDLFYFCTNGLIHNYSYLPAQAECYNPEGWDKVAPEVRCNNACFSILCFIFYHMIYYLTLSQMCVGWRGRRKWFIAMEHVHRINTVDIHHLNFANEVSFHDVPALVAKDTPGSHPVSDIFIRHFRYCTHMCRHALSPSILSLPPSQHASANAPALADSRVYVTFAAGGKFKVYYNGELFLEPDSDYAHWRLYGAYVTVSRGGTFSFVMEDAILHKKFIGCFGSNVCTGFNDENSIICTREQPPDGWMLPSSRFAAQAAPPPAKNCSITSESSIWSPFQQDTNDHQCMGLSAVPAVADAVSCSLACCSMPTCTRFQWCSGGSCNTSDDIPKCWIGHSTNCQVAMSGWVSGVLRSVPSASEWHRALPIGELTTLSTTVEAGLDKRAQWLWPPNPLVAEPQMFCRYSIP